jgi:hypothetical protein
VPRLDSGSSREKRGKWADDLSVLGEWSSVGRRILRDPCGVERGCYCVDAFVGARPPPDRSSRCPPGRAASGTPDGLSPQADTATANGNMTCAIFSMRSPVPGMVGRGQRDLARLALSLSRN